MRPQLLFFIIGIILLSIVGVIVAQENTCEMQESDLATIVSTVCSAVGENEVCYGNLLVNLVPQAAAPDLNFDAPGDMAGLNNVRSLFLSALNESNDTWGIAQMRLLAVTSHGAQEVLLLLFGDVRVDNEVDSSVVIPVQSEISTNVRSAPYPQAVVMESIQTGETVEAIGRLADSSWIRVRMPETNLLGWVLADLLIPVNGEMLDTLAVQGNNEPYFGAMQAISLTTGDGGDCGNFETDGLLIQTPAGTARVTLLINEVTIELIPSGSMGVTAFIQSNPENGMDINVIDGSTFVSVDGDGYYINAGSSTNITLDNTSSPTAPPTFPTVFNPDVLDTVVLLETVRDPDMPVTNVYTTVVNVNTDNSNNTASDTGSNGGVGTTPNMGTTTDTGTTNNTGATTDTDTTGDTGSTPPSCTRPGNSCNAPGHNRDND